MQVNTFVSWANLFHVEQLIKLGPAAGSTLALWLTMHYLRSPLALPAVLLCIPLLFHAVLLGAGWSLADAADAGWVMQGEVRLPARSSSNTSAHYGWGTCATAMHCTADFLLLSFVRLGRRATSHVLPPSPLATIAGIGCRLASRNVHHVEKRS